LETGSPRRGGPAFGRLILIYLPLRGAPSGGPVEINPIISEAWLTGYVDGDGSFFILLHKASDYKCGFQAQGAFDIAQLSTERDLLDTIGKKYFGNAHKWAKSDSVEHLRVLKFSAHQEYVEPFFKENHLLTPRGGPRPLPGPGELLLIRRYFSKKSVY